MVMHIRKPVNEGTSFREQWKEKFRKKIWTKSKEILLKGSRKMNILTIKLQKHYYLKRKLNTCSKLQMEYWEIDIEKVNEFKKK